MQRTKTLTLAAIALGLLIPATARAATPWPETKTYTVAGSVGFDVTVMQVSGNNAFGPLDCETGVGGACFDTSGHDGLFSIVAGDLASGSVGIFAGFDMDGDGCVGCDNANGPPGSEGNPDMFWQGADRVDGFIPFSPNGQLADPILYTFVRVATLQTGDTGTTGDITIRQCTEGCKPAPDTNMGTVCTDNRGQGDPGRPPKCGGTEIRSMYPYPEIP